jgi:hypothetical protein
MDMYSNLTCTSSYVHLTLPPELPYYVPRHRGMRSGTPGGALDLNADLHCDTNAQSTSRVNYFSFALIFYHITPVPSLGVLPRGVQTGCSRKRLIS